MEFKKSITGGSNGADEQVNQYEDLELAMKTDHEIREKIAWSKKNLLSIGEKLPDRGDKLKAYLRRYENEIERRNKLQSNKKDITASCPDGLTGTKPSDGVDAQVNEIVDNELVINPDREIRETAARENLHILGDKFPDKGEKLKAAPCRHEDELERRNKLLQSKKKDSTTSSADHLAGNKPSESQSGVAANTSTVDATEHDSLTDAKMQKIVNELVNVGISETDVGKAAELCYKDPVKVKVLFALPSHLRRFYVLGFLRN